MKNDRRRIRSECEADTCDERARHGMRSYDITSKCMRLRAAKSRVQKSRRPSIGTNAIKKCLRDQSKKLTEIGKRYKDLLIILHGSPGNRCCSDTINLEDAFSEAEQAFRREDGSANYLFQLLLDMLDDAFPDFNEAARAYRATTRAHTATQQKISRCEKFLKIFLVHE